MIHFDLCDDNNNTINIIGNDGIKIPFSVYDTNVANIGNISMNNIFDSDNKYKYWSVDPTTPSAVNVNANKYDTF